MRRLGAVVAGVAAGALALGAIGIAVASGVPPIKPDATHGLLEYRQVNGHKTQHMPPGRVRIVRLVHLNGQVQFSAGTTGLFSGSGTGRPGRYRFKSFSRHCHHCGSQHPTIFGRKFSECSQRVRLKKKVTTTVRVRLHRKHPCTIRVWGPHRNR
jgi:hypothetical protein